MPTRKCAPLDTIPQALEKTGFLLEHAVAEEFRAAGWTVIGNRYYADDVDGRARELDLIVYKAQKTEDLEVITGVLISCKKDAENTWCFLSEDKPAFDPNQDWDQVHYWTDCEPLATYLGSAEWKKAYIHEDDAVYKKAFHTSRSVFAFQLVSQDGTAPKNDKPIFDSISGLLKALDHEVDVLPSRTKGKKRIYLFTLATIVDAPLVEVRYKGKKGKAVEIDNLVHLAKFMVKKREISAFVHFVKSDATCEFVAAMSALSSHNFEHMVSLTGESYEAIRSNAKVRAYFAKRLESRLLWRFNNLFERRGIRDKIAALSLTYLNDRLCIEVDSEEQNAKLLNEDAPTREAVKKALNEIARYQGNFVIDWDLPF